MSYTNKEEFNTKEKTATKRKIYEIDPNQSFFTSKKVKKNDLDINTSQGLFPKNTLLNLLKTNNQKAGLNPDNIYSLAETKARSFNANYPAGMGMNNQGITSTTVNRNLFGNFDNGLTPQSTTRRDYDDDDITTQSNRGNYDDDIAESIEYPNDNIPQAKENIRFPIGQDKSLNFLIKFKGQSKSFHMEEEKPLPKFTTLQRQIGSTQIKINGNNNKEEYMGLANLSYQTAQKMTSYNTNNYLDTKGVSVSSLGLDKIFEFPEFNEIQSGCLDMILNTNLNMIISAPTGSGKTVLFELAIAKLLKKSNFSVKKLVGASSVNQTNFKIIYLAPIKSLCQQKYKEWFDKFSRFGINVLELTGDSDIRDLNQYESAHIIITTPEKWDSLTRKWRDNNSLVSGIALVLIDEVHLLNTEERGATLEAVISRMKIISKSDEIPSYSQAKNLRFIAVSATIPNIEDIAEWLEVSKECIKQFGQEYRSIKLEKYVFGYNMAKNEFQFERNLNYRLVEILRKYSSGKPSLIFCQTQKGTISACEQIIQDLAIHELIKDELQLQEIIQLSQQVKDKNLQKFLIHGVGFHNASMAIEDRKLVEQLFIQARILVICTTSTLAMGVNLPARLVIIKSTLCYRGAGVGYTEYSALEIEQMMGRAGRPQFDNQGIVVIMTEKSKVGMYQAQVVGKEELESHLYDQLVEHLNAEISLLTIKSVDTLMEYLKGTFFYIRIKKNPVKYGLPTKVNVEQIDKHLKDLGLKIIEELDKYDMINYHSMDGKIIPLELGQDMSRYYVAFSTMKNLMEKYSAAAENVDMKELIEILSDAGEFQKYRSRLEDRKALIELNGKIKYSLQGAISTSSKKANVLIQCGIGSVNIEDWDLKKQQTDIMTTTWRILMCFKRYFQQKRNASGLVNTVKLIKFIGMKTWDDNKLTILKQLYGIGDKMASLLIAGGLNTFDKIIKVESKIIEGICGKSDPWGYQLQKRISMIPRCDLHVNETKTTEMKLEIELLPDKLNGMNYDKSKDFEANCNFYLVVRDSMNRLLLSRFINPRQDFKFSNILAYTISLSKLGGYPLQIELINDKFVGLDIFQKVMLNSNDDKDNNSEDNVIATAENETSNWVNNTVPNINNGTIDGASLSISVYNLGLVCSHKCKNKDKCKHQCCKVKPASSEIHDKDRYEMIKDEKVISNLSQVNEIDFEENLDFIDDLITKEKNNQNIVKKYANSKANTNFPLKNEQKMVVSTIVKNETRATPSNEKNKMVQKNLNCYLAAKKKQPSTQKKSPKKEVGLSSGYRNPNVFDDQRYDHIHNNDRDNKVRIEADLPEYKTNKIDKEPIKCQKPSQKPIIHSTQAKTPNDFFSLFGNIFDQY